MWQKPKTDWTADDYLNLETDFNRIEGNLHAVVEWLQLKGVTLDNINEKLNWSKADFLAINDMDRIIINIDELIMAIPAPWIPNIEHYNFCYRPLSADGMNEIEAAVQLLGWVMEGITPLLEHGGCAVCDKDKTSIFCSDGGSPAENYQSIYTGTQINEFVRQMKEWNNGTI